MYNEKEAIEAGVPILPAYEDKNGEYVVFCTFCGQWHHHSRGDGTRVPHCESKRKLHYPQGQYYLKSTGQSVTEDMLNVKKYRKMLKEANETQIEEPKL